MTRNVRKTEQFLRQSFEESEHLRAHPADKLYRLEHTYRVANIGREIARAEGLDEEALVIACLLHDLSYCEDFGEDGWKHHGRRAAQLARPFLETLDLTDTLRQEILYGIAIHVDDEADFDGERTPLALSVCDADSLDRFDVYRIYETLVWKKFSELTTAEKAEQVESMLARLERLKEAPFGTNKATELWLERLDYQIGFYTRLAQQLEHSVGLISE